MKKLKLLVASALTASMLVGCGSNQLEGKTYTYSAELDIKNLDSSDADDGMSFSAMHACIDGLMGVDEEGNIVPAIAEEHTVSEDGLTHTFKLRDAQWSNGDEVTANDFVYAWQRIIKNSGNYAYMLGSDGAKVKGADELMAKQAELGEGEELTQDDLNTLQAVAVDDKTFQVTLTSPVSYFEELMTFPCYYPINQDFCEEKGAEYAKSAENVLSNGAFIMETWEPGRQATFSKNENYWNADAVKLDNLVLNLVQEPEVAATAFDNGETQFALINSELVDKYKDSESYKSIKEGYLFYLQLNFGNSDLQNLNLRKALSYAINREDFVNNVLKDGSTVATGFVPSGLSTSPSGTDFRSDAGSYTSYDLEQAQQYLDAAKEELGKDTISLRLLYGTDESPMDQLATYLQDAFSQLDGLEIEMVATTKQDRIYTKQANQDFDIACTRWGPDYGDPTTYLNLCISDNTNNYGKWSNTEYDSIMDQVAVETDVNARWQLMIDAEKIMMDDLCYIPVFEKGSSTLQDTSVTGLVQKPVGVPYTFNYVDIAE